MNTIRKIITGLALITTTIGTAHADRYDSNATYAKVVDVQPIFETYEVPQNKRVCRDQPIRQPSRAGSAGGAVLGSIIGGVIGSQFGSGNGRKAATAAGILAGAAIGSQEGSHRGANQPRRHCYTKTTYHEEQRVTAYDVSYEYDGQIRHTTMQNHPGERVKVQVNVQVVDY